MDQVTICNRYVLTPYKNTCISFSLYNVIDSCFKSVGYMYVGPRWARHEDHI